MKDEHANNTRVVVRPRSDISAEEARDIRARAWAFVFQCYEQKKNPTAGQSVRGNSDGTRIEEDSANAESIPE